MKSFNVLLTSVLLTAAWSTLSHGASPVTFRGPDTLQLEARSKIEPMEIAPETSGLMHLQYSQKGQARKQNLKITATGLETDSQVGLTAAIDSDVNVTKILDLPTDRRGRANATFFAKDPTPQRLPKGKQSLPEIMTPLTRVRAICVENSSSAVIGFAWLANATTYRYNVRRNLTAEDPEGTAQGSIRLNASAKRVNLKLLAGGLTPDTTYSLVLNSTPAFTATSDEKGRLSIQGWSVDAPLPLNLRTLALVDGEGGTVLSTNLP